MADRRNLKDRAKSAGKSVAGTLKQGAQALKDKARTIAKDDDTGIEISEVQGQYLVIDSDGSAIGPYDDKMKAASKARQLKQENQQATQDAQAGSARMEDETGQDQARVQKAATRFSQGVNRVASTAGQKAKQASESVDTSEERDSGPQVDLFGGMDNGDSPSLDDVLGQSGDTPELQFGMGENTDGPSLPGFGMDNGENLQMPSMMGEGPEMGQLPFGNESDDGNSTDAYPWF